MTFSKTKPSRAPPLHPLSFLKRPPPAANATTIVRQTIDGAAKIAGAGSALDMRGSIRRPTSCRTPNGQSVRGRASQRAYFLFQFWGLNFSSGMTLGDLNQRYPPFQGTPGCRRLRSSSHLVIKCMKASSSSCSICSVTIPRTSELPVYTPLHLYRDKRRQEKKETVCITLIHALYRPRHSAVSSTSQHQ